MVKSQEYNGWQNFATWKVHLELFDGMDPNDLFSGVMPQFDLARSLRFFAEAHIEDTSSGVARDWALAFLSDVDFHQIARHMQDAYPQENEAA